MNTPVTIQITLTEKQWHQLANGVTVLGLKNELDLVTLTPLEKIMIAVSMQAREQQQARQDKAAAAAGLAVS